MSTANGPKESIDQMKERLQRARLQIKIKETERQVQTLEAFGADYFVNGYAQFLDMVRFGSVYNPISTTQDRRAGRNFPFFVSETDLATYRAPARVLLGCNAYAQSVLAGLTSYVICEGFKWETTLRGALAKTKAAKNANKDPDVRAAQNIWEEFCEDCDWSGLEQELFWRTREDGEYFLDHGYDPDNGRSWVRTVEPEQIYFPTSLPPWTAYDCRLDWRQMLASVSDAVRFGVFTDAEDVQTILGYAVHHFLNPADWNFREVWEVTHAKINTKRSIKRGLTDFCFSTYDALEAAEKLRNNLTIGSAVRAAIAFFRQHKTASQQQLQAFVTGQSGTRVWPQAGPGPQPGVSRSGQGNYQAIKPGQVIDIDGQMDPKPPPITDNAGVEIVQMCLRGANKWNAPEWLLSGLHDTSSFASSLTAESPFVKYTLRQQKFYKSVFSKTWRIVMRHAVETGRLRPEALECIAPKVEAPQVQVRDVLAQAQVDQIYALLGEKSLKTISQEQGRDYEEEQINIAEQAQTGGGGTPLKMPGQGDAAPKPPRPDVPAREGQELIAADVRDMAVEKVGGEIIRRLLEKKDANGQEHAADCTFVGAGGGGTATAKKPSKEAQRAASTATPEQHAAVEAVGVEVRKSPKLLGIAKKSFHGAKRALEAAKRKAGPLSVQVAAACHMTMSDEIMTEFFSAGGVSKGVATIAVKAAAWGAIKALKATGYVKAAESLETWLTEVEGVQLLEGWVTIGHDGEDGAHVFIDKDGKITNGPAHMVGKSPGELKGDKSPAPTAQKEEPKSPPLPAPAKPKYGISGSPTEAHYEQAKKWTAASNLSPELATEYSEHLVHALSKLPGGIAKEAGSSLKVGGVKFHGDLKALRAEATKITGKSAAGVVGFARDRGMATDVHLDGGDDPRGTYVHELWHAADNQGTLSDDKGWQSAYKKDILKGKHLLSRYAMTNASEGFAEFGRALAERGLEYMTERFPNAIKHLKAKGLIGEKANG